MVEVSRRKFLRRSGGYAAVVSVPAAAVLLETDASAATSPAAAKAVANPTGREPASPVMAYVHDAKKGTVVIMSGTTERTVQDRELVKRLTTVPKKARKKAKRKTATKRKTTTKKRG